MLSNKFGLSLLLSSVFLLGFTGQAQVITSKKEAQKKGVYQKPSESAKSQVSPDVQNAVSALVGSAEKPKAATKPSTPVNNPKKQSKRSIVKHVNEPDIEPTEENYVALQMVHNAMTFLGTRYLGGGTTAAGMDCSGMVTAVFKMFDLPIPRSSRDMAKVGKKIDKSEVKKGDLVFFKTNGGRVINHVGLVVEVLADEIKFIHSSTQRGVIVSSTKEAYYQKSFVQANRLL